MIALLNSIRSALLADPKVSAWAEGVFIREFDPEDPATWPEFETHAVVITPLSSGMDLTAIREEQETITVNIQVLRWAWNDADALTGTAAKVPGILQAMEDARDCLAHNNLGGAIDLTGSEHLAEISPRLVARGYYYLAGLRADYRLPAKEF